MLDETDDQMELESQLTETEGDFVEEETEEGSSPEGADTPPQAPSFDADAFARALAQHLPQPQQQQAPAPQMTDDEIRRQLNYFTPTADHVNRLLDGGESAVQAANELVAGIRREMMTVFPQLLERKVREIEQNFAPVRTYIQQEQDRQAINLLITEHKDLAPLKQNLPALATALQASGWRPSSNDPKVVRQEFAQAIRRFLPAGTLPASGGRNPSIPNGHGGGTKPPAKPKGGDSGFDAVFNRLYGGN